MENLKLEDLKILNSLLKDLSSIRTRFKKESVEVVKDAQNGELYQGEYGQSFEVYKNLELGVYIKLEIRTDSYGCNDYVHGVTFVNPVEKLVTIYEEIK